MTLKNGVNIYKLLDKHIPFKILINRFAFWLNYTANSVRPGRMWAIRWILGRGPKNFLNSFFKLFSVAKIVVWRARVSEDPPIDEIRGNQANYFCP